MTGRKKSQHGKILFFDEGIFLQTETRFLRIADPIFVTAFGRASPRPGEERAFTIIEFLDRRGNWKRRIISSAALTNPREFITKLATAGYVWPPTPKLRGQIIAALAMEKPSRDVFLTAVPGHHGDFFVLPDETYGPAGPERDKFMFVRTATVQLGGFRRSGTLEKWQQHIASGACLQSSRARLAVAASFAAPNLRLLNINSFGLNFSGPTSRGKTLLNRLACSSVGLNREEGPVTFDGSDAAFEQRALGHRDCILPLDELSHLEDKIIAKIRTMYLASNRLKPGAGQYVLSNDVVEVDWRVVAISTSEDPIWDAGRAGPVRDEEVRMIDVPACVSHMNDVFDGPEADNKIGETSEQRGQFVQRQERLALKYQGEAFRAYLTKRARDKSLRKRLRAYISEFVDAAPLKSQFPRLGWIRHFFAVIYASAALAIDYDVLPWGRRNTLNAIRACMDDAVEHMVRQAETEPAAEDITINSQDTDFRAFRELVADAKFIRLNPQRQERKVRPRTLKRADGIIRPTSPGKVEYLLFDEAFNRWYPDASRRKRLAALLRQRRIIGRGRRDTSTRQIFISELGRKVPCYRVFRKRLLAS